MSQFDEIQQKWAAQILAAMGSGGAVQTVPGSDANTQAGSGGGGAWGVIDRQGGGAVAPQPIPQVTETTRKREEDRAAKAEADQRNSSPGTKFEPSKPVVEEEDGRLSASVEYEKLPKALKDKLSQQFWGGLGTTQRRTLVETYRRLKQYGVWDHIKKVTGEKEHPERHVKLFGFEFQTDGNSGAIAYEATDGDELVRKLKATGRFGEDGQFIGYMHKDQRSVRETPKDPNEQRGVHISTQPGGKKIDAHIDKHSPTGEPDGGRTRLDPNKAWQHGVSELVPESVRKFTRGVPIKPTIEVDKSKEDPTVKVTYAKIEVRGPVEKEKTKLSEKPAVPNPADPNVQVEIARKVGQTKNDFPISVGTIPDNVPEAKAVATKMAALLLDAGKSDQPTIEMDVPYYLNHKEDQPRALKMMEEIGQIVRSELGAAAASVRALKVTFGTPEQKGYVSLLK